MEDIFKSFCAFGSGNTGDQSMGSAKLAKFSRDMKLLDKKLTPTEVDIIFSKVKKKNEQKIKYEDFLRALQLMSGKKYPNDEEGFDKLEKLIIEGSGPQPTKATKPAKKDVIERLTDPSKYTGSHKERFDDSGKGKGLAGRYEDVPRARDGYVTGYKNMNTYDAKR